MFKHYVWSNASYSPDTGWVMPADMGALYTRYRDEAISNRPTADYSVDGKPAYGSAGIISQFSPNTPWSDTNFSNAGIRPGQVAAYPGQEDAFSAFQEKYPGYAQVAGLALGAGAGGKTTRDYVLPESRIWDDQYGWIAPVAATGHAGKKPIPYMKAGGAALLSTLAPAVLGITGAGSWLADSLGVSQYAGGGGADVLAGGGADALTEGATAPLIGPGAMIPDYTGGILANPGSFGAPLAPYATGGGAAVAAPLVGPGALIPDMTGGVLWDASRFGSGIVGAAGGGGGGAGQFGDVLSKGGAVVDSATKWMRENPIATMMIGRGLSSAFTPDALDVQNNAAQNQQQLEAQRRAVTAANTNTAGVRLGIKPSGQPLRDLQGNPVYPRRV